MFDQLFMENNYRFYVQNMLSLGKRQSTPRTDRQTITGLTFTPMGNLESPVNLTVCL